MHTSTAINVHMNVRMYVHMYISMHTIFISKIIYDGVQQKKKKNEIKLNAFNVLNDFLSRNASKSIGTKVSDA